MDLPSLLTICVTTFKRPDALQRCIRSIKQYYPQLPLLVQDTNGNLSAGRNALVNRCRTQYYVMMEDDMEFTENTNLETLVDIVHNDGDLIGCGCRINSERNGWCHDWQVFRGKLGAVPSTRPVRVTERGNVYRPCQLIENFGVFRTRAMLENPWDEQLELAEHQEWYYRIREQWLLGYSLIGSIEHSSVRDGGEYDRFRARAKNEFRVLAEKKCGLEFLRPNPLAESQIPCIVVMGVGHSNTTITTQQLGALGWNLGEVDEYAELPGLRDINISLIEGQDRRIRRMWYELGTLKRPWAVKDPRFDRTLHHWLGAFAQYEPLLLWVDKDLDRVLESYERRGENASLKLLEMRWANCQKHYNNWPWAKFKLHVDQITQAVSMYDVQRVMG